MTMNELAGAVPGGSIADQAVFLSGLLAEQGVSWLRLEVDGRSEELPARRTDLPGVISRACAGGRARLHAESLELFVELSAAGLRWRTGRAATAAMFG